VHNRTGLLVVRVWIEGDSDDDGLRARITQTVDLLSGAELISTAATSDDVCAAVRAWLEAYLDG
jgi:hypothetical protein